MFRTTTCSFYPSQVRRQIGHFLEYRQMVFLDLPEPQVLPVLLDQQVLPDSQVPPVLMEPQVLPAPLDPPVLMEPQVLPAPLDPPDLPELTEPMVLILAWLRMWFLEGTWSAVTAPSPGPLRLLVLHLRIPHLMALWTRVRILDRIIGPF